MKINDPFAESIGWQPLLYTGKIFGSRKALFEKNKASLVVDDASKFALKSLAGITFLFLISPLLIGLNPKDFNVGIQLAYGILIFGSLITGIKIYLKVKEPINFDKGKQSFTKGKKVSVEFKDIYALQLIEKSVEGETKEGKYIDNYYQLNLVLNDRERVHVIDQKKNPQFVEYALSIAEFIEKPLWDRTEELAV